MLNENDIELKCGDFSKEWEDPIFFDDFLVKDIPCSILPAPFDEFAEALSERLQTPTSATVMCILSVLATVLQGKFRVYPQGLDYSEPLNLYLMVVMPPANRKSAILSKCTEPLIKWQLEQEKILLPKIMESRSVYESELKLLENKRKQLGKENADTSLIDEIKNREINLKVPEVLPRLFITDSTAESLNEILLEQKGKISVLTDEGGFFNTVGGMYTGGVANIDVLLKGWDQGVHYVRRKQKELFIRPLITLFITTQPIVLENIKNDRNFMGKGFFERILFCEPPSKIGHRKIRTKPINLEIINKYEEKVLSLLNLKFEEEQKLTLSVEAREEWFKFQERTEVEFKRGGLFEDSQGWGGKISGQVLRIAGILHVIKNDVVSNVIEIDTMKKSIELIDILSVHAVKTFCNCFSFKDSQYRQAKILWDTIRDNKKKMITKGEITFLMRHKMLSNSIKEVMPLLIDRNLISEPMKVSENKTTVFFVNPKAM